MQRLFQFRDTFFQTLQRRVGHDNSIRIRSQLCRCSRRLAGRHPSAAHGIATQNRVAFTALQRANQMPNLVSANSVHLLLADLLFEAPIPPLEKINDRTLVQDATVVTKLSLQ